MCHIALGFQTSLGIPNRILLSLAHVKSNSKIGRSGPCDNTKMSENTKHSLSKFSILTSWDQNPNQIRNCAHAHSLNEINKSMRNKQHITLKFKTKLPTAKIKLLHMLACANLSQRRRTPMPTRSHMPII